MGASLSGVFSVQQFTDMGTPLVGGRLYTYAAGTTSSKSAYTDPAGTIAHTYTSDGAGGLYIALNARGELPAPLWLLSGGYDLTLKRADGSLVWTRRAAGAADDADTLRADLTDTTGTDGKAADLVLFLQSGVGAVSRTSRAKLRDFVSARDFGAVGDGSTDDTAALQAAINTGKPVQLRAGDAYGISAELSMSVSGSGLFGGGTIKLLASHAKTGNTLSAVAVTATGVTLDGVTFDGSAVTGATLNNRFVWCTAPRLTVIGCSFISLPKGGTNFNGAIGASAAAPYLRAIGNYFTGNPGSVFVQGRNCVISGNVITNPNDASIALNSTNCVGCVVAGNSINNEVLNSVASHIIAEEGASQWVFSDNFVMGIKDGIGIGAINVVVTTQARGGRIIGNVINGGSGTTTNPCGLISVSGNYIDADISHNLVFGCPTGNSNSRLLVCNAKGTKVTNNVLDGDNATGLSAVVGINAGLTGVQFSDNETRAPTGARHYLFSAGDYGNIPAKFKGGRLYGGAEGINSELNAGSIANFSLWIDDIDYNTATSLFSAGTALGSRQTFLNAGAWKRPHRINDTTDIYGTAAPTVGTYVVGDRVNNSAPSELGSASSKYTIRGWVCTVAGAPGTWLQDRGLTGN